MGEDGGKLKFLSVMGKLRSRRDGKLLSDSGCDGRRKYFGSTYFNRVILASSSVLDILDAQ